MFESLSAHVREHEMGLWFSNGDFRRLVGPGRYRLWRNFWPRRRREHVEVQDLLDPRFEHPLLKCLVDQPDVAQALEVIDLADDERALVRLDGRLETVLGPGLHAFWRGPRTVEVERYRTDGELRFEHPQLDAVLRLPNGGRYFKGIDVDRHEVVLLFRNGELVETLRGGRHVFWLGRGEITWRSLDLREQTIDVAGQEIMTQDKVGLRVNLVVQFVVADPELAVSASQDFEQALYRDAQLALRAAIGGRSLDALLADKASVGAELRAALQARAAELGLAVRSVGLRDIVLPGEMRTILNQVLLAEREAQANLIRRREETAAARSQANTAKLLADNPVLARLKELEILQEILAGANATFVIGKGDLADELRSSLRTKLDV